MVVFFFWPPVMYWFNCKEVNIHFVTDIFTNFFTNKQDFLLLEYDIVTMKNVKPSKMLTMVTINVTIGTIKWYITCPPASQSIFQCIDSLVLGDQAEELDIHILPFVLDRWAAVVNLEQCCDGPTNRHILIEPYVTYHS